VNENVKKLLRNSLKQTFRHGVRGAPQKLEEKKATDVGTGSTKSIELIMVPQPTAPTDADRPTLSTTPRKTPSLLTRDNKGGAEFKGKFLSVSFSPGSKAKKTAKREVPFAGTLLGSPSKPIAGAPQSFLR